MKGASWVGNDRRRNSFCRRVERKQCDREYHLFPVDAGPEFFKEIRFGESKGRLPHVLVGGGMRE